MTFSAIVEVLENTEPLFSNEEKKLANFLYIHKALIMRVFSSSQKIFMRPQLEDTKKANPKNITSN